MQRIHTHTQILTTVRRDNPQAHRESMEIHGYPWKTRKINFGTIVGARYGRIYCTIYGTTNLAIHQYGGGLRPPPPQWGGRLRRPPHCGGIHNGGWRDWWFHIWYNISYHIWLQKWCRNWYHPSGRSINYSGRIIAQPSVLNNQTYEPERSPHINCTAW